MNAKARYEYKLNALIKAINEATGKFKHGKSSEEDMAQCRKDVETTKLLMLTGYYLQLMEAQDEEQSMRMKTANSTDNLQQQHQTMAKMEERNCRQQRLRATNATNKQ